MKRTATFFILLACSAYLYADNYFSPETGRYYVTANNFFYRPSTQRGNEVVDRKNASIFLDTVSDSAVDITDSLVFDSYTSSKSLIAEGSSEDIKDTKFYTHEAKLIKKVWNDKLELYGGSVLGANPYQLNNMDSAYDTGSRVATFASGRTGAKYNVTDDFGFVVEGQYNLTGEMADNTDMFTGFDGAQYRNSKVLKTGFEWNF